MLMGESVVLGLAGGFLGVLIAFWAVTVVRRLIPSDVPGIDRLAIDWRNLAFAAGLALIAAPSPSSRPSVSAAGSSPHAARWRWNRPGRFANLINPTNLANLGNLSNAGDPCNCTLPKLPGLPSFPGLAKVGRVIQVARVGV
jgi:hypothetical protein